jgi:hypothetical protein
MGYSYRPNRLGGDIQRYWPDDTDTEIYIDSSLGTSLDAILELILEKWPNISLNDIIIESEYIHTDCIGYDLYDAGDWTNFILIRRRTD